MTGLRYAVLGALLWCGSMASVGAVEPYLDRQIEVEGVSMRLQVLPQQDTGRRAPTMGEQVDLRVEVQRLADDQPLSNLPIGLWLDRQVSPMSGAVPVCGQRVASFLSGGLLSRPLLDLTGYWVMTMDREGSISVLDPTVEFAGRSSLYTSIQLGATPFDWVQTADDSLLFVALPSRNEVAVIDLGKLRLQQRVTVAGQPTRLALQPDGRLLWAAYRGADGAEDGIAAIDVADGRVLHTVPLPPGHHEIAFSEDSRYLYVTSRDSGMVSTLDTGSANLIAQTELGGQPIGLVVLNQSSLSQPSLSQSSLNQSSFNQAGQVWVIDGAEGVIHRLDRRGAQIDRVVVERGLGPAKLTPDGRHLLIVNPSQHRLEVVDTGTAKLVKQITISGRPYDIMFTELYAYVRTLDIEQVAIFPLARLPVTDLQYLPVGSSAVSAMPELPIASTMANTFERNGAFFVSPSERTLYHYMEGMNAPDSSVRAYGHTPMAVRIVQRGLREVARGRYATSFRFPSSGPLVLALAAEAPRIRECIGLQVGVTERDRAPGLRITWAGDASTSIDVGQPVELRFRVADADGGPVDKATATAALLARVVPGGGGHAERWPVEPIGTEGEYRVRGTLPATGGYYVHVESRSPEIEIDPMNVAATVLVSAAISGSIPEAPADAGSVKTGAQP
jgi:YVTN family beta-propeller protein